MHLTEPHNLRVEIIQEMLVGRDDSLTMKHGNPCLAWAWAEVRIRRPVQLSIHPSTDQDDLPTAVHFE